MDARLSRRVHTQTSGRKSGAGGQFRNTVGNPHFEFTAGNAPPNAAHAVHLVCVCVCSDVVNTGARLAVAAARQGERVFCSEAVATGTTAAQLHAGDLQLQPAGAIKLKGKQGENTVFKPLAAPEASAASMRNRGANIVGRQPELDLLLQTFRSVQAGRAGVVLILVEGGAGIGKSAIAEKLIWDALQPQHATKWLLLRGHESSVPFEMCRNILKWLLELDGEAEAADLSWLFTVRSRPPP